MRQDEPVTRGMPSAVPDDGLSTQQRRLRPALIVNTGDGKGKSTAAFGMALRGWNQGWSIGVYQFVKSPNWRTGEKAAFDGYRPVAGSKAINAGKVVSREDLLREAWGWEYITETKTVDTHIKCLRAKLGPYAKCIVTVRKVGYKFEWLE